MNREEFIKVQVIDGAKGDQKIISDHADCCIETYRRGDFECASSLILEFRDKLKGRLALCDWVTVKGFMTACGLSEYRARKALKQYIENDLAVVNKDHYPFLYKCA